MKKIALIAMVLMLSVSVAACERKQEVKVVKTEKIVAAPQKAEVVSLQSLDRRVSLLEKRNAEVDAAVRAKRAAAKRVAQ